MKKILITLLSITTIFLIIGIYIFCLDKDKLFLFIATAATALFTFLLVFVAWTQLTGINARSSADFIHRLKNDYFRKPTRKLFHLIDRDCIIFNKNSSSCEVDDSFFEVNKDKVISSSLPDEIKQDLLTKIVYSTYEIDDLLLGHFEDVGLFEKTNVVDISMVYEEFDYYLYTTHRNKQIEKYLEHCREGEDNDDTYDKFSYIYEKCRSYGKLKRKQLSSNIIIGDILELIWKAKFNLYIRLKDNSKWGDNIIVGHVSNWKLMLKTKLYAKLKENLSLDDK